MINLLRGEHRTGGGGFRGTSVFRLHNAGAYPADHVRRTKKMGAEKANVQGHRKRSSTQEVNRLGGDTENNMPSCLSLGLMRSCQNVSDILPSQ